ncbi:hypothetical protein Sjap_014270 [Stephania japonica]|uniref:Uncharacterized protein n=1 Tax=Stephania japonica TaxID=461633 RepID=A0AAP0J1C4_9MAGN
MSSSSSSASVRVEKATSDLLMGPDWTMNMDICDSINSHNWQAKDVVKAVKKRLQNKNPRIQILSLTLLETMIKNCGDFLHFQIAEKNILQEMIKIVKKKTDMQVRDKILVLLDSWQEAFGGPGGKYPQYYWAYEELRRAGVEFPERSRDAAPIFTPPVTSSSLRQYQPGFGMPSNSSIRLDEAMASETETLSLSSLESMRSVMELLSDMLQAVNPNSREAVKDEVIVDLVSRCRSNQKKLMEMLNSTGDEELLGQGLTLNDDLRSLLAKHDSIASGSPLPIEPKKSTASSNEEKDFSERPSEVRDVSPKSNATSTPPTAIVASNPLVDEDEEDDDFAQLARRFLVKLLGVSSCRSTKHRTMSTGSVEGAENSNVSPHAEVSTSIPNNALALPDPPSQVRTTSKEQDIIDLLSITLSTTSTSPRTPQTQQTISGQATNQVPTPPTTQGYPYGPQHYPGQASYNNYIAPWAQPQFSSQPRYPSQSQYQPQLQPSQQQYSSQFHSQYPPQPQPRPQTQSQFTSQSKPQYPPQPQPQPQPQPLQQNIQQMERPPQQQPHYPQTFNYPPPPWATAPSTSSQSPVSAAAPNPFQVSAASAPVRTLQNYNSFPDRANNVPATNGELHMNSAQRPSSPLTAQGQKPFIPSYRLFEDLNVLGKSDAGLKATSSTSTGFSGMSGPSMVGGRK